MMLALRIARAEWAYLARSRVTWAGLGIVLALSTIAAIASYRHIEWQQQQRAAQQHASDHAFDAQPARHPHRMVHYGTYAHRLPGPLAAFDPGVDPFTGTVIYLEGHRQNSALFSEVRESSGLLRFGQLTPAFVLQTLLPVLLIFIGFATVCREREGRTLDQLRVHGVPAGALIFGKLLALASVAAVAVAPALGSLILIGGTDVLASTVLGAACAAYMWIWLALIVAVSALARTGRTALIVLVAMWAWSTVLVPRSAVVVAEWLEPTRARAVTDLVIQEELRAIGDSHDSDDPYFNDFRKQLLETHGVDRVEDLPFNYRGRLSQVGEALTAGLFASHAQRTAEGQREQAAIVDRFGVLAPMLAVRRLSMAAAGSDLEIQLRFLEQAEAHRYDIVQRLNRLHESELTYVDDSARSSDAAAEHRTRVAADHWRAIPDFEFVPAATHERLAVTGPAVAVLSAWCLAALGALAAAVRSLRRTG